MASLKKFTLLPNDAWGSFVLSKVLVMFNFAYFYFLVFFFLTRNFHNL